MTTSATMIAAALALALQGAFAGASANATSGHCIGMTVTDYVESDAADSTTQDTWQNVTDGLAKFTTSSTGCVMITFSTGPAYAAAQSGAGYNFLYVRTLLDGNNLCVPATYNLLFHSSVETQPEAIAAGTTRICKNVAAGAHTVQVQYHNFNAGGVASIFSHVLTVTHN